MSADINLQSIAAEALATFPPMADDTNTASDYAQRMLTKILSQKRKEGIDISEQEAQALRATLDRAINTIQVPSPSVFTTEAEKYISRAPKRPETSDLEPIISDCFHTATDGSPQHLKYLGNRAMKRITDYLKTTEAGWLERMRLKLHAKRLVKEHIEQILNTPCE